MFKYINKYRYERKNISKKREKMKRKININEGKNKYKVGKN